MNIDTAGDMTDMTDMTDPTRTEAPVPFRRRAGVRAGVLAGLVEGSLTEGALIADMSTVVSRQALAA